MPPEYQILVIEQLKFKWQVGEIILRGRVTFQSFPTASAGVFHFENCLSYAIFLLLVIHFCLQFWTFIRKG